MEEEKAEVGKDRALLERERAVWAEERRREGDAKEALDMCRKEVGLLKREVCAVKYAVKYVVKYVVKCEQEVQCVERGSGRRTKE